MEKLAEQLKNDLNELIPCISEIEKERINKAISRFKAYEDAEEQGMLMWFPCKVGDTVYEVTKGLSVYRPGLIPYIHETVVISILEIAKWVISGDFGKTIFLTHEEAKKALEEVNRNS